MTWIAHLDDKIMMNFSPGAIFTSNELVLELEDADTRFVANLISIDFQEGNERFADNLTSFTVITRGLDNGTKITCQTLHMSSKFLSSSDTLPSSKRVD